MGSKRFDAYDCRVFKYAMKMNVDDRGSFTELVHTEDCGQVSINISNLSETENLVTVMNCNEIFNTFHPDTFFEKV